MIASVIFKRILTNNFYSVFMILPTSGQILSVKKLYACYGGDPFYLVLNKDAEKIHEYVGRAGRKDFIDVELADGRKIWMKTVGLSCSIQNMILMLQNLPDGVHLEE